MMRRVPAPPPPATSALVWEWVHDRGMEARSVAARLGISKPRVFEMLATFAPVAAQRETERMRRAGEGYLLEARQAQEAE